MAVSSSKHDTTHLHGIVDMGSNGIRFSISTLQPPTSRIMPTLYQHRAAISLYDAQYSASGNRQAIPEDIIKAVCSAFQDFQRTCNDFGVPSTNITVLATEATRTALNSEVFRSRIKHAVGWDVTLLPKEEEGRIGALGVASSLPSVSGLVMDLGGGSTQLSWLIKNSDGAEIRMPEGGAVSMPYGAAAMSRRLAEAQRDGKVQGLRQEVKDAVRAAYQSLSVPSELKKVAKRDGGFTLYLSGGGFRGWGYVLMSQHRVQPYPVSVINGFSASRSAFLDTGAIQSAAVASLEDSDSASIFRVSERRAGQVPAVAFLVNALAETLPEIKEVRFCQGGVREGYLFTKLPAEIRSQHPLVVATEPFDLANTSGAIRRLLLSALPPRLEHDSQDMYSEVFTPDLLEAFANLIYFHSSHSKDLQSSSALRSTTSGILAGVHGVLHENRALLALLLCQRWGGSVPPTDDRFKSALEDVLGQPWTLWWINYLGSVAALIAGVFPAGVTEKNAHRLGLRADWVDGKKDKEVYLQAAFGSDVSSDGFADYVHGIEKVGKRKRWVGGRDGVGYKVAVTVSSGRV
ncbi:retrograde regulation protein 2 [Elasticomyces elasticus]|nr:retrograde regulation protein 2 [Elasticomyces elasticus]KAK4979009.1 retrograde regulation protein 2 [Elasticomyces elasticus]